MAQENSNSTMEMGTSDQVLVATKSKKTTYIIGFVGMLVAIGVVVTLVVVLSGNEGGGSAEPIVSTTEGPTTPISTSPSSVAPSPDPPTTTTTPDPDAITTPDPNVTPTPDPIVTPTPDPIVTPTPDPDDTSVTEDPITITTPAPVQEPLQLEEIINGNFAPISFNATWTAGSDALFKNEYGDLIVYDVDTDSTTRLIANTSETLQQSSRVMLLAPDGNHVVLALNAAPVYRFSFLARYAIVDVIEQNETIVTPPTLRPNEEPYLQNFVWGPTGTSFAYVYYNDIYYQPGVGQDPVRITENGREDVLYNGIPDWVYEEEVFSSNVALWFSQDGTKLAFVTFDDTNVRVMKVPHYGVPGSVDYQYTAHHEIRYPKPGTTNPTVWVTLRDLTTGAANVYNAPTDINEPILKAVSFVNNAAIALMWSNRAQTTARFVICTHGQDTCTTVYDYTENNGWIENIPLKFNAEGTSFVTILPWAVEGVRYKQVVQLSPPVTGTTWTAAGRSNTAHTVIEILHWSSDDIIYYKATHENDSGQQHIYTTNSTGDVECFTCNMRRVDGGACLYNDATVSVDGNWLVITCAGPDVPQVYVYSTNGTQLRVWDDNSYTATTLANRVLPHLMRLSVPIQVAGLPYADVQLLLPVDFDNRTDVPLLVYVYGGPDTALVTDQWSLSWESSLVSRWGIAVAMIDGRGSGLRGIDNMFAVNRRLGSVEIEDQIHVTRYLQSRFDQIDASRTCIWGWSYGGYAASLALARGGDVFKCAAAVAPVVDWRFYDTIYTERYMDTPMNNAVAYTDSSLLKKDVVESYRNKNYFMIHGTADDNVHYQHSMLFSRLLQVENVQFTQMSYTDEDHGLVGVRPHLYHALEKFLGDNFNITIGEDA